MMYKKADLVIDQPIFFVFFSAVAYYKGKRVVMNEIEYEYGGNCL